MRNNTTMKRILIISGIGILFLWILSLLVIDVYISRETKHNIEEAKALYSGNAEEALIAYLQDDTNSYYDRSHVAIWTLGKIRSKKALPILKDLYMDDPTGESCVGNHDTQLCQRELSKAIVAIEHWSPFTHKRLQDY